MPVLIEQVAAELDPSLLLHLAAGRCCLVYDFGSRNKKRGVPRALWMGAEFVRFALTYLWGLERPATAVCRGHNVSADFERSVRAFSPSTKRWACALIQSVLASQLCEI